MLIKGKVSVGVWLHWAVARRKPGHPVGNEIFPVAWNLYRKATGRIDGCRGGKSEGHVQGKSFERKGRLSFEQGRWLVISAR